METKPTPGAWTLRESGKYGKETGYEIVTKGAVILAPGIHTRTFTNDWGDRETESTPYVRIPNEADWRLFGSARDLYDQVTEIYDYFSHQETLYTGWGEGEVPKELEDRRKKLGELLDRINGVEAVSA